MPKILFELKITENNIEVGSYFGVKFIKVALQSKLRKNIYLNVAYSIERGYFYWIRCNKSNKTIGYVLTRDLTMINLPVNNYIVKVYEDTVKVPIEINEDLLF